MKIISWNVNGVRAVVRKGFLDFVKKSNSDVLCLQEIKAHPDQVNDMLEKYEYHFWHSAKKKGYAGTAIFSKEKPLRVKKSDSEGRIIALEFKKFFLVTVYVPNSGRGLPRLAYRKKWDIKFRNFLKRLDDKKPVIICGDLNVAHTELDLANPKSNYNKTAGYTQQEIDDFQKLLDSGFVDTFRMFTKGNGHYTYWSYMFNARKKNIGWRIDYFLVSKRYRSHVKSSKILSEIQGSDHCPIKLEVE